MINQLRTLLLNQSSSLTPPPDYPGEEFVPANYGSRTLSKNLLAVHQLLFGINPDRAMLNYRLHELLGIIHNSQLREFVYALDPRVTYWPSNDDIFNTVMALPTITKLVGTKDLYLLSTIPVYSNNDILNYGYLIDVTDGSHVTVQLTTQPLAATTFSYTVTSGLSSLVPLPGSGLSFEFQSGVGSQWTLSWLARPSRTLMDVYTDLTDDLTSDLQAELFGSNPAEPMKTFRNSWEQNPYPPYKLGAVTLALGYQINNLAG